MIIETLAFVFIAVVIFFITFIAATLADNSKFAFIVFGLLTFVQSIVSAIFILTIINGGAW